MSFAASETVTITLSVVECQALARHATMLLAGDPTAAHLVERLLEGASLGVWLRDHVRLEVSRVDAAILRELRHHARSLQFAGAVERDPLGV